MSGLPHPEQAAYYRHLTSLCKRLKLPRFSLRHQWKAMTRLHKYAEDYQRPAALRRASSSAVISFIFFSVSG